MSIAEWSERSTARASSIPHRVMTTIAAHSAKSTPQQLALALRGEQRDPACRPDVVTDDLIVIVDEREHLAAGQYVSCWIVGECIATHPPPLKKNEQNHITAQRPQPHHVQNPRIVRPPLPIHPHSCLALNLAA